MQTEAVIFEPLPMRRREMVPVSPEEYWIISTGGEVREVRASTAYEAFKLSGFRDALKIERRAAVKMEVLAKNRFVEAAPETITEDTVEPLSFRRKSPVVSADDLGSLMSALQTIDSMQIPMETMEPPQMVTSPTGVEIHGDGYDELIPAQMTPKQMGEIRLTEEPPETDEEQPKATAAAPQEPAPRQVEIPPAVPSELPPEQELTQDEVTKLLNG